jgi:NADP-dependent 3-hydroxy acid dehydrogenase YdfG
VHHKIAHAVVTGAGGGIGSAIAVVLLASGIKVSLMGRKLEPLEETIALSNGAD